MKFCGTVLWLFFLLQNHVPALAQKRNLIDSLELVLQKKLLKDTTKVKILIDISNEYRTLDPLKALEYADKAFEFAKSNNLDRGTALAKNAMASAEIMRGHYGKAIIYLQKSLIICNKINDKPLIATTLHNLGTVYQHQGEYHDALVSYQKSLQIRQELNDKEAIAISLNNMGMIYEKQGHYTKALEVFFESLKLKELANKQASIANTFSNIGRVYYHLENDSSALHYHFKALAIRQKVGDLFGTSISFFELGKVNQNLTDYALALEYYFKSLKIQEEIKHNQGIVDNYMQIGEIYFNQHKYEQSRAYLEKAHKLAEKIDDKEGLAYALTKLAKLFVKTNKMKRAMFFAQHSLQISQNMEAMNLMRDNYLVLYEIHKKLKENDKALFYYERGIALQDSLLNEDKHLEVFKLQADYQIDKQAAKIELLDKDKKIKEEELMLKTLQLYSLIGGTLLLLLAASILLYRFIEKQKANRILTIQKTEILERSEEILQQQEELSAQNESLMTLNVQVSQQKEEIEKLNSSLEEKIKARTDELEEAVEKLVDQNKDLEQFAYIVSHNLRSPIAHILGLTALFELTNEENTENKEMIGRLQHAAQSLDLVISDLNHILDIKGTHIKTYETIDLNETITKVLASFAPELQAIEAQVQTNLCATSKLFVIKEYVENTVFQLLSNAIKFRAARRPLQVMLQTFENENYIVLEITDNGLGVYDDSKLFRLYQRQHPEIAGKGLGLFLVKTQIDVLDGKIEAESKENVGATFRGFFKKNV